MSAARPLSFIGIVIILMGIVITIYGFSFQSEKNKLVDNGISVKGKVVGINKNAIYRSPFVKFKTKNNKTVTFLSKFEVNVDLFKYKVGQEVDVIYNKNNPKQAEIDDFWEMNVVQIYLGSLGLFLILLGLFLRWRGKRKAAV